MLAAPGQTLRTRQRPPPPPIHSASYILGYIIRKPQPAPQVAPHPPGNIPWAISPRLYSLGYIPQAIPIPYLGTTARFIPLTHSKA